MRVDYWEHEDFRRTFEVTSLEHLHKVLEGIEKHYQVADEDGYTEDSMLAVSARRGGEGPFLIVVNWVGTDLTIDHILPQEQTT